jgi:hypothetical protein
MAGWASGWRSPVIALLWIGAITSTLAIAYANRS